MVILSPTHTHTTNIMHLCTTHHLKLRMDWTGNEKRKWSFLVYTHKHHALLYNSPSKVENGLDRKQGKAVVISTPTHTNTCKHHALLHNSHSKVENGLDRERGKEVVISSPTHTHKHHALLYNSPPKVENGLDRK